MELKIAGKSCSIKHNYYLCRPSGEVAELADCTGLENRRAREGTGGSNPSLSATHPTPNPSQQRWVFLCAGRSTELARGILQVHKERCWQQASKGVG